MNPLPKLGINVNNVDVLKHNSGKGRSFPRSGIFSIANQLRFGVVSATVLALLLTSGILIFLSFQTQQHQLRTIQEERANNAAAQINAFVDDLQRKLSFLARVRGLTEMHPRVQLSLLEGLARHHTAYETLAILDNTGQVVQLVEPYGRTIPPSIGDSPAFLRAFNQREDFVGAVKLDPATNLPYLTMTVPIRDQNDEVDGVLLAMVNLKFLWFITSQVSVGVSGYAYVIDQRGLLIAKKGSVPESFRLEEISSRLNGQNFESNKIDRGDTYQGLEGMEVVGASAPVRTPRWNVVVELLSRKPTLLLAPCCWSWA